MNKKLANLLAFLLSFIMIVSNPMSSLASTELDTEVSALEVRVTSPDSDIVFDQIEDAVIPEEITEQLYQVAEMNGISRDDINLLFEMGYGEEEIAMMIYDPEMLEVCLEEVRMYFEIDECI